MNFEFTCTACEQVHRGMPAFIADKPLSYYEIPAAERESRCCCGTEECVIDDKWFFIRGCLEIPVQDFDEPFVWGVWVSVSEANFRRWRTASHRSVRSHIGPFFGWLNAWLKPYPDTTDLKARVHLRDNESRPYIELEPTNHPLAQEQSNGITKARVVEIYAIMQHGMRSENEW